MRLIKRHRNRRLYDTGTSSTLTQVELAEIVRNGTDIKVVDTATDEDITLEILGRIMAREAVEWGKVSETKKFFIDIIQSGGAKSMSILKNTILASIGAFQVTKAKAEQIIDELIRKGDLDESERKTAVLELLEKAEKSTAKLRDKVSKEASKAQTEISKIGSELKKYKWATETDLKKLEAKVNKLVKSVKSLEKKIDEL